jgi:hypothetical protein
MGSALDIASQIVAGEPITLGLTAMSMAETAVGISSEKTTVEVCLHRAIDLLHRDVASWRLGARY